MTDLWRSAQSAFTSVRVSHSLVTAMLAALFALPLGSAAQEPGLIKAINLDKVNTSADEVDPCVTANHLTLLYATQTKTGFDVFVSKRGTTATPFPTGKPWSDLINKPCDKRSPFWRDGTVYFSCNAAPAERKDLKNFDLWHKKGEMAALPLLGDVNQAEDDMFPWVTPSGKEFYFSRKTAEDWVQFVANGPTPGPIGKAKPIGFPPGFHHATLTAAGLTMYLEGPVEKDRLGIYRCKRTKVGGPWSKPEPLDQLNHPEAKRGDMGPSLSGDGSRLYFVSDRPGGKGGLDIWYVATDRLKTASK